jgi:hypothetical protein
MRDEALKRAFLAAGVCALVAVVLSCTGFPEAEGEGDTLVIGSLILDFPDGLYDNTAQKVDMNVRVSFRNVTRNQKFHVYTKRGYFYFPTNGTDDYILEGFRILKTEVDGTVHLFSDQPVGLKIANAPNRVIYLGHITASYSDPRLTRRIGPGGRILYYRYQTSVTVEWDQGLLQRYITVRQPDGLWLDLEIIECGRNSQAQWRQQALTERRSHRSFLPQM